MYMLEHITQKADSGDCAVPCIALYCNVPYERVMQSVPPDVYEHGLWLAEVLHTIEKISNVTPSMSYYNDKSIRQLSRYEFPKQAAIYGCLRIEAGNTFHYVFSDGEYLHDPLLPDAISLSSAKTDYHSGWLIVAKIF